MQSPQKLGIFSFQSEFWCPKTTQIFLKMIFCQEYETRRTIFSKMIFNFDYFLKLYLVKKGPFFEGWTSSSVKRYWNILSVCSFRGKYLLNFTCTSLIFHNRHHTTVQVHSNFVAELLLCTSAWHQTWGWAHILSFTSWIWSYFFGRWNDLR